MICDINDIKGSKWLEHEKFKDFVSSLQILSAEEQEQQKRKLNFFVQYLEASIRKHFQQWIDRLFFLGIFGDQPMARSIARHIIGNTTNSIRTGCKYYSDFQKRTINLHEYDRWISGSVSYSTVMNARSLPIVADNYEALRLIAIGEDMWRCDASPILISFRNQFLMQYPALPTNTQFVERGVKESGYVCLGRRCEENRTILTIARGKVLPEALAKGREELCVEDNEDPKRRQLSGKRKAMQLMKSIYSHCDELSELRTSCSDQQYNDK